LLGVFALGGVEKGADQVGLAVQLDFLRAERAIVDLPVAGTELHFHGDGFALALGGPDQLRTLFRVEPQAEVQGGATDGVGDRPAEEDLEILVGFADQAVGLAGEQDHVRAQVKQRGEALFGVAEGVFPLALAGSLADHPDHAAPAGFVRRQAAVDFQPVLAAIRPLDVVVHGLLERLAGQHRVKRAYHPGAVLRREQVQVLQILGQRLARVEAEQRLGAPRPTDTPGIDFPAPCTQPCSVKRCQQLRGAVPALFRLFRVQGVNAGQGWHRVDGIAHYQKAWLDGRSARFYSGLEAAQLHAGVPGSSTCASKRLIKARAAFDSVLSVCTI